MYRNDQKRPEFMAVRLSALAATIIGVIFCFYAFNITGEKKTFVNLSGFFFPTVFAMLVILLTNDVASVIFLIRKRSGKVLENGAFTQRFPAAAIGALCALAAATFPIVLVLLQNALEFPSGQDYQQYPLVLAGYLIPAFIPSLYFRLLPGAHMWYIPVSFFVSGIAGTIITWVIFQNVFLGESTGSFKFYMKGRWFALASGLAVYVIVPIADFVLLSQNKE